ncbi:MAG: zinc ribbon domain-containing protein [Oscillospiraceae bacterium]
MNCPQCSAPILQGNSFCTACGTRVKPATPERKTAEINTSKYVFYLFVMSLPVIGAFVCIIMGYFTYTNESRRALARAMFFYHALFLLSIIGVLSLYILGRI